MTYFTFQNRYCGIRYFSTRNHDHHRKNHFNTRHHCFNNRVA